MEAYTDSVWQSLEFEVQWGGTARKDTQTWDGHLELFNGHLRQIRPVSSESAVKIDANREWRSTVQGTTDGIRAAVLYTQPSAYNSFDETVVTVRTAHETFSFAISDLVKHGHIFIPDFGVLVRSSSDSTSYADADQEWQVNQQQNIYRRVLQEPEQNLTRAWKDVPQKGRHYIPLSFEGGRQHFGLDPDGSVFCNWNWLARIRGKDTQRCLYEGNSIRCRFGLSDATVINRERLDGHLPMMSTQWQRDGVQYRQIAFVIPLAGVPKEGARINADDTRMMTEHALPNIGDWRGDHFKSSDEANSTYWLRMMYVLERGQDLWLGAAIPRDWLTDGQQVRIDNARTYFGPMSMQLVSRAASGSIEMTIDPPRRNPPRRIVARFRHPDGQRMTRCQVNDRDDTRFDATSESVELTECVEPIRIVAFYN